MHEETTIKGLAEVIADTVNWPGFYEGADFGQLVWDKAAEAVLAKHTPVSLEGGEPVAFLYTYPNAVPVLSLRRIPHDGTTETPLYALTPTPREGADLSPDVGNMVADSPRSRAGGGGEVKEPGPGCWVPAEHLVKANERIEALETALSPEVIDVEIEDALTSEGIFVWGPDGERFERMFKIVMDLRARQALAKERDDG